MDEVFKDEPKGCVFSLGYSQEMNSTEIAFIVQSTEKFEETRD